MANSLQKIDHNFPDNIDQSISDFKKTVVSKNKTSLIRELSQSVKIQTQINNITHSLYNTIEEQIKESLEIQDKKIFGLTINKKLKSHNHDDIIQSFKEKLKAIPHADTPDNMDTSMKFFILINNLALYLSNSGTFITKQDYQEMDEIIKTKGTNFTMGVLKPELSIDKNTGSTEDRGRKFISISINMPKIFKRINYNNEDTPTLKKLSEFLIQDGNHKLLASTDKTPILDQNDVESKRKEIIKKESEKFKGYYSIGGKFHFPKSIPQEKIDEFEEKFGFESTGFKLIHANKSLLLPPSCSPNILLFYILALEKFGLISGEPDLQLSIPGRLPNRAAGILGSATLLSGDTHTEYPPDAFSTTHNHLTGARIMAYDDGVLNNKFKHNSPKLSGRTDMLGIVDLKNVYTYHILGSIISQTFYGGKYEKIGKEFIKEYVQILSKYNLQRILKQEWIYNKENDNETSSQQHYELIKIITDLQKDNREAFLETKSKDGLIVFDIKNLLNKYKEKLKYK